jgi:hypothetical protein
MTLIPIDVLDPSELHLLGNDLPEVVRLDRDELAASRGSDGSATEDDPD